MKERPILFSAPMVRAILEGRKTMTRRVIKHEPHADCPYLSKDGVAVKSPYGKSGDHLWVRETFNSDWCDHVIYRADGGSAVAAGYAEEPKWKPSIFMPRWASRITLEITNVRVERLKDISEEDSISEGIFEYEGIIGATCAGGTHQEINGIKYFLDADCEDEGFDEAYTAFRKLWESINGAGSWDANPFVWVIEFKML